MNWFLIVLVISSSTDPKFYSYEMTDKDSCIEAVKNSKTPESKSDNINGSVGAIFCSSKEPDNVHWSYKGNLWVAKPKKTE